MKRAKAVNAYRINDYGKEYLVRVYRYREQQYGIIINLNGGSDTKEQHKAAQAEIEGR